MKQTPFQKKLFSHPDKYVLRVLFGLTFLCLFISARSQNTAFKSTEVHSDNSVTFRYAAPRANEVKLGFQFLKNEPLMTKDSSGVWNITVNNVVPNIYPYNFIVDGIRIADPKNSWLFPNEGFQNSLIEIKDKTASTADLRSIPHGTVSYRYYSSSGLGERPIVIYTPPGYEANTSRKYPVLFLLHGSSDTEETWTKVGRANLIMDNLIHEGKAKPMIVVMPYGRCTPLISKESGSIRNWDNLQLYRDDFKSNIYPFIMNNYRALSDNNNHAIAGFSGGGGQALFLGLNNPDLFSWVCGFAPGMLKNEFDRNNSVLFSNPEAASKNLKLFWIGCGKEDGLYSVIQDYMKVLDQKKIKYEHLLSEGGHTWMNCRLYLTEIAQKLFQ